MLLEVISIEWTRKGELVVWGAKVCLYRTAFGLSEAITGRQRTGGLRGTQHRYNPTHSKTAVVQQEAASHYSILFPISRPLPAFYFHVYLFHVPEQLLPPLPSSSSSHLPSPRHFLPFFTVHPVPPLWILPLMLLHISPFIFPIHISQHLSLLLIIFVPCSFINFPFSPCLLVHFYISSISFTDLFILPLPFLLFILSVPYPLIIFFPFLRIPLSLLPPFSFPPPI